MNRTIVIAVVGVFALTACHLMKSPGLTTMDKTNAPRGVRNNNPLNIRTGNDWKGEAVGNGSAFEVFTSPEYGFRAGAITLRNYRKKYGLTTVREIISRWSPSSENDTAAYIAMVCHELNVTENQTLNLSDDTLLARLMLAMSIMENGRGWFTLAQAKQGIKLAS
ncbi:structural protein [Vibrio tritonius]|uniref:structural protein n=1 Tax=Vibrio tritonius TaxID=1435069 RepID=UPI00315DEFC6